MNRLTVDGKRLPRLGQVAVRGVPRFLLSLIGGVIFALRGRPQIKERLQAPEGALTLTAVPSPVGHTLAGLCGYMLARKHVRPQRQGWFLMLSVALANLPDADALAGLLWGDPRTFHHQATHSLAAAMVAGLLIGGLGHSWNLNAIGWGFWGGSLYFSHVALDLLANDPIAPFGAQLLWPYSQSYYISPVTPFARFDYFDPEAGILGALLSLHNLATILHEVILLAPLVALAWYVGTPHRKAPS